jgi:hypothetical protein
MGRIPVFVLAFVGLWIAFHVVRDGPERALGGLFGLLAEPQYGEEARPTRSGKLAERQLEAPGGAEDDPDSPDSPWWSAP